MRDARPPWASKFFRFHAVFGKIWRVHTPPGGFTPPPRENPGSATESRLRTRATVFLPPANEVWGKVIFSEACVKNSVHGRVLPQCMLGYTTSPWEQPPPPQEQAPQEQAPPGNRHPPGPGTPLGPGTPRDQTPPSRACWEIRSTSRRYASYWNAILCGLHAFLCT